MIWTASSRWRGYDARGEGGGGGGGGGRGWTVVVLFFV